MNPNQPDAPTAGLPAKGLRVTPLTLSVAMAAVIVMLFTVLFMVTAEPEPAPAVAVPQKKPEPAATVAPTEPPATPSDPAPTGTPKYAQTIDPCAMVPEEVTKKLTLFPDKSQIYKEECEWSTLDPAAGLPDNISFTLTVYVKVFPNDLAAAHEQFLGQRAEAAMLPDKWEPVQPPIGDASWSTLYTLPGGTDRGPTTATVGVRASNAVIQVEYRRRVNADPQGHLTKGALEVARAVAAKLG